MLNVLSRSYRKNEQGRKELRMGTFKVLFYEDMHEEGKAVLREKADIFFAKGFEEAI
jgi:hypothetical protein